MEVLIIVLISGNKSEMLEEENRIVKDREDRSGDNVDKVELTGKENSCILSNGELNKSTKQKKRKGKDKNDKKSGPKKQVGTLGIYIKIPFYM